MTVNLDGLGLAGRFSAVRTISGGSDIHLMRIASDASFQLVLTDFEGKQTTIVVHTMPPDFPAYTTTLTGSVTPGNIYTGAFTGFAQTNPSYNLIFAADGSPVYFRRFDHPVLNFHRVQYHDGAVRYAYLDAVENSVAGKGTAEGDAILLDEGFRQIRRIRLAPNRGHGEIPAECHDFIVFGDDHFVLSSYYLRTLDLTAYGGKANSQVVTSILQEIDRGHVVWEWDSADYPELFASSVDGNDYMNSNPAAPMADYMHFNSIDYDPNDRGFILSFRHQDAVMKILPYKSHPNAPIEIKWILGGKLDQFGLTGNQIFYHQHDPRVVSRNGSILGLSLFNNNNGHYSSAPSSAMIFSLNEDSKTATLTDQYIQSMNSSAMGSVQVLAPRNYFIGWGADNRITEVSGGTDVFTMDFADGILVYRAQKAR